MIRINAFFEVKSEGDIAAVQALGNELVEASRKDEGCVAYDLFESTTNRMVMMFCETWVDEDALARHAGAPHFVSLVPRIEALTRNGMKLERFNF